MTQPVATTDACQSCQALRAKLAESEGELRLLKLDASGMGKLLESGVVIKADEYARMVADLRRLAELEKECERLRLQCGVVPLGTVVNWTHNGPCPWGCTCSVAPRLIDSSKEGG